VSSYAIDLVLLVADLDQEQALRALIDHRSASLGTRRLQWVLLRHPRHDAGCLNEAAEVLQPFQSRAAHALVVLDREGSGQEDRSAVELEKALDERLSISGWGDRARSLVIDPELEIWVWSPSPKVDESLGWAGRRPSLRDWLGAQGFLEGDQHKPARPKEAMRAALREVRRPVSAATFGRIAREVSLERCGDSSFGRFRRLLQTWFPKVQGR
jgi:hypothetical protein